MPYLTSLARELKRLVWFPLATFCTLTGSGVLNVVSISFARVGGWTVLAVIAVVIVAQWQAWRRLREHAQGLEAKIMELEAARADTTAESQRVFAEMQAQQKRRDRARGALILLRNDSHLIERMAPPAEGPHPRRAEDQWHAWSLPDGTDEERAVAWLARVRWWVNEVASTVDSMVSPEAAAAFLSIDADPADTPRDEGLRLLAAHRGNLMALIADL